MKLSHLFTLIALCAMPAWLGAKEPDGYYDTCKGKKGAALLNALEAVVGNPDVLSYKGLWGAFETTDVGSDGKLIDMYSTVKWNPGKEQCGNYSVLGDCYNREHSFPKSWFDDKSPMYSDLYHLYPTDGKVNGQRSNYPFGECSGGTYIASNSRGKALGRLGASTFAGYSGTVFEPDDQYKGDFARTYFYMAAAYNSKISSWSSPMLAGNSYPAYTTWAVNLLLKWHREDPVDDKELKRNDAVSSYQHNRNPFIDHPELAEHIWGNAQSEGWNAADTYGSILTPADGTSIDLGYLSTGHSRKSTLTVRTDGATQPVSVAISGSGLSVTPSTLTATAANAGATVTITATAATAGPVSGTLTITSATHTSHVAVKATAIDGIGLRASRVTAESIEVEWVNVHDADELYELYVTTAGVDVDGFPEVVDASDEGYTIGGLEPSTTYAISLNTPDGKEGPLSVTTSKAVASISVIASGSLDMESGVGEATEPLELTVESRYVDGNIAVSVGAPFEVSTDKASWSRAVELLPEEDRFYLRAAAAEAGDYKAQLHVSGDGAEWEEEVTLSVSDAPYFLETFEVDDAVAGKAGPYKSNVTVQGVAGSWTLTDAGFEAKTGVHYQGERSMRFGKDSTSALTLAEDLTRGAGTVSFYAANWSDNEGRAVIHVESSTDGGRTWTDHGSVTLTSTGYELFKTDVKKASPVRFRLRQSSGARFNVDDISVSPYSSAAVATLAADDAGWDAYCRDGQLVIESSNAALPLSVYSVDAKTLWSGSAARTVTLTLPAGVYIVASDTHARRVLVK
ncbi:MAG: endonuclease [Candidatus Amulumruptor caecigallinarius]|nr:endonuclease [Candidatus Amulumruptor caecigallinarius]MCM1396967.1 endonuclease [Candidatus Amulumruptor caecigallinarius]MCM1453973.1 endonuclease [bacterium]